MFGSKGDTGSSKQYKEETKLLPKRQGSKSTIHEGWFSSDAVSPKREVKHPFKTEAGNSVSGIDGSSSSGDERLPEERVYEASCI